MDVFSISNKHLCCFDCVLLQLVAASLRNTSEVMLTVYDCGETLHIIATQALEQVSVNILLTRCRVEILWSGMCVMRHVIRRTCFHSRACSSGVLFEWAPRRTNSFALHYSIRKNWPLYMMHSFSALCLWLVCAKASPCLPYEPMLCLYIIRWYHGRGNQSIRWMYFHPHASTCVVLIKCFCSLWRLNDG